MNQTASNVLLGMRNWAFVDCCVQENGLDAEMTYGDVTFIHVKESSH